MRELSAVRKIVLSAMCATLCVVLPLAFHMIPNAGSVLSPMHIPVLVCGLVCGWSPGLLCGLVGPALSCFATGMPSALFLPSMMIELATYGALTGLLAKCVRTRTPYVDLYLCLVPAMLAGRVLAGLSRALMFAPGGYTLAVWASSYFITTAPGIVVHLILVPVLVMALERARFVPARYGR